MVWRPVRKAESGRTLQLSEVRQVAGICERWGWKIEGRAVTGATHPIEQEELPALWPAGSD